MMVCNLLLRVTLGTARWLSRLKGQSDSLFYGSSCTNDRRDHFDFHLPYSLHLHFKIFAVVFAFCFFRYPVVSYAWIFSTQTIRSQAQTFCTQPSGRFVPNKLWHKMFKNKHKHLLHLSQQSQKSSFLITESKLPQWLLFFVEGLPKFEEPPLHFTISGPMHSLKLALRD